MLPRYLPDGVYFLLSRRPFLRERSGLLIEAPSQCLDLADHPEENGRDVQAYIQGNLTPLTPLPYEGRGGKDDENDPRCVFPFEGMGGQENYSPLVAGEELGEGSNLKSWLSNHHITEREFCDRLTTSSENNFMYLTQIMGAITDNLYSEPFEYNQLPPALAAYYQQHLQMMLPPAQQQELSHAILNILATQQQPISAEAIAQALTCQFADILDIDEFTVEEILENWLEFLQRRRTGYQTQYQLYHSSFRDWIIQIWS